MSPATQRKGQISALARAKGAARLAAVQALYQMELTGADVSEVSEEFVRHRLDGEGEGEALVPADRALFTELLNVAVARQLDIDNLIEAALAEGWTLARLDSTLRALLRAASAELMACSDTPARVVIDEYVDVAHAFYAGEEPSFVNGVLDSLARRLRPGELSPRETPG
jgi:N utilization substance protein B